MLAAYPVPVTVEPVRVRSQYLEPPIGYVSAVQVGRWRRES